MDNARGSTILMNNNSKVSNIIDKPEAIIKDENKLSRLNLFKFLRNPNNRLNEKEWLYKDIKENLKSLDEKGALDYIRDSIYMDRGNKQKNLYGVDLSYIYPKLDKKILDTSNNDEINITPDVLSKVVIILDTPNNRLLASKLISRILSSKVFSNI